MRAVLPLTTAHLPEDGESQDWDIDPWVGPVWLESMAQQGKAVAKTPASYDFTAAGTTILGENKIGP